MRKIIILFTLISCLIPLMAYSPQDVAKNRPLFATDRFKIKLTDSSMHSGLPRELGEISTQMEIASLDALMKKYNVSGYSRAHRTVNDKLWEKKTGFDRWFILYIESGQSIKRIIKKFGSNSSVELAIPEYVAYHTVAPNDTHYANQWGHNNTAQLPVYSGGSHSGPGVGTVGFDSDAELAWNNAQGWGNSSVIVAIIDSGVDTAHEDLSLVTGYDYGDNDSNPMDDAPNEGHGTACAGVATANANNNIGIAGIAGGCWVMPLKVADNTGTMYFSYIENALTYAGDHGAEIGSMSLGASMDYGDSPSTDAAVDYAYNHGVCLFAATANGDDSTIDYPANHPNIISVGAASPCGERKSASSCDGESWWGFNYGVNTQDARNSVDVCAPTILPATDITGSPGYSTGQYSMYFNGTSCATPYAAGVGALVLSQDPTRTPAQLRQILTSTATDMTADGGVGWDRYTGYGLVNANAAVMAVSPGMPTCSITYPANGSSHTIGALINVQVDATDSDGTISHVKYYLNSSATASHTDYVQPYTWSWNTSAESAGDYIIEAIATDNSGNYAGDLITITLMTVADEGFETGDFSAYSWVQGGNANWLVQTADKYSGAYAAQSGNISSNQTSSLSLSVNVSSNGTISFYQRVSSESTYDFLKFYIDTVWQDSWSGDGSWTLESYPVSAGMHTFKWEFEKDGSVSSYSDCGYIDHIVFPPFTVLNPPQITWSPSFFTENLAEGNTSSDQLSIGNTGDLALNYTCAVEFPTTRAIVFEENFNGGSLPTGWSNEHVIDTQNWAYYNGGHDYHPATAYEGSHNAYRYNSSSVANVTKLVTPAINLSGSSQADLLFWHTQEIWVTDQDELRVYYKTSSGGSWNLLATYTNNITSWTQESISLPNLSSTYYIAFEGSAQWGYGVCIDLVQVDTSGPSWLSVDSSSSASGTVNPGAANDVLTIGYDATLITSGIYNANLHLTSNSDSNNDLLLPVTLTVTGGTPAISVSPASLAFGVVETGTTADNQFSITNTGTATLSGSITTPVGYSVAIQPTRSLSMLARRSNARPNPATPERNTITYTIGAGQNETYDVTFAPTAAQSYTGNIIITHNASGGDETVYLSGTGGAADISLTPTSFTVVMQPEQTRTETLSVDNLGNIQLDYQVTIDMMTRDRDLLVGADFEVIVPPSGWTSQIINGTGDLAQNTSYYHSGSASARAYWDTVDDARMITPQFISTSDAQLDYWVFTRYNGYGGDFAVEVSTDGSTWSEVDRYNTDTLGANVWTNKIVSLSAWNGQNIYIAFRALNELGSSGGNGGFI
ncbi:MAG: S8 family serine peptidase, partial [Candidatus Cloacimonetes bacterium]|nr:S8 family serine peptidase [Candidatus Cloacimonadota bacterium]